MKIIAIYKKLKIELDLNDFSANKKYEELKLAYENKSSKIDESVAVHEAKHLVCALHCEYFVDSIDINNDNNKLGGMNFFGDVDIDYEKELLIAIAPYLHEIISFRDVVEKQNLQPNKDFEEIIESVEILANGDDTKKDEIFRSQYYEAQFLLKKYQKKIEQFKSLLMKYKILDHEEIMQQWESDELIEINREQNEVKFAKNNFFVKRVKLITYCPELIEQGIYKDVKHIFKTDFIENFLSQSPNHPINQTIDKKIAWGFAADFTQQEAVIKAKNSDNIIIQGPPGTGKTQTILNIIIDALFHNKKILICVEKITALKVIEDRIKTKAPILNNFIFNIFSDTGNISFFQELAKKMINITKDVITHSTTSFLYNYENEIQKIQLIKNLATKLINLDLPKLYSDQKKWKDEFIKMGINRQNIDELLKSVVTKDLNELLKREGEMETIENWKKQLDLCKKFHDDHFDCNFPKDEIKKIHELNNSWTYNEQNRWRYALYYYTKKSNVNFFLRFFIKKKYDEKAKKLNFDKLFLTNVYQEFTNYCNFDDKKYTDRDLIICQDIKKIHEQNLTVENLIEIKSLFLRKDNYDQIVTTINGNEICNYHDIDEDNAFAKCHNYIFTKWHKKIDNLIKSSEKNKKIYEELISYVNRKKTSARTHELIKINFDFFYEVFPVVLCTPETLCCYIPKKRNLYDIVIIDEASQVLVERAISAIYRAKKRIISGDFEQLRPEIHGPRFSLNQYKEKKCRYLELIENDSILDLFSQIFPKSQTMLSIHYRSEKKELIDFSNKNFYNNKLVFVENPQFIKMSSTPIEIIDVNGKWIDQTNEEEALEIVKILENIYNKNMNSSVGVIVFSKKQARKIIKKIYNSKCKNLINSFFSNEPNSLFIKPISEVQGEERDIIVFGVTYGNNVHNYHLLSGDFAQNKINVAITRAKKKIYLIKSHKSYEYRKIFGQKGSELLIKYIEYCEELAYDQNKGLDSKQRILNDDKIFQQYLLKNNKKVYQAIKIKNKNFYLTDDKKSEISYLVNEKSLLDIKNNVWFFNKLFRDRGYQINPILITDIYKIN